MALFTTISSGDLAQDIARARKAARRGPVFITDEGETSHVLLSIEDYRRLIRSSTNIADMLAMPGAEDIEIDLPERTDRPRSVDVF